MGNITNKILSTVADKVLTVEKMKNPLFVQARMNTCRGCPKFDKENISCTVCGCFMNIKTTLKYNINPKKLGRREKTHCPLGKWDDLDEANKYRKLDGKELLKN